MSAELYLDSSVWERHCSLSDSEQEVIWPPQGQRSMVKNGERGERESALFLSLFLPPFYEQWLCLFVFLIEEQAHIVHSGLIHALPEDFVCLYLFMPPMKHGAGFCESWLKNHDNHVKPSFSCFESLTCVLKGPLVCDIRVLIVMRVIVLNNWR